MPRSSTPADRLRLAFHSAFDAAFRSENHVGSAVSFLSRLYHAACMPPVYASQPGSPPNHATLGPGWWLAFAGAGLTPAGLIRRFQYVDSFYIPSPFSRLFLAHFPRKRPRPPMTRRPASSRPSAFAARCMRAASTFKCSMTAHFGSPSGTGARLPHRSQRVRPQRAADPVRMTRMAAGLRWSLTSPKAVLLSIRARQ
jgi:hypothetical protein